MHHVGPEGSSVPEAAGGADLETALQAFVAASSGANPGLPALNGCGTECTRFLPPRGHKSSAELWSKYFSQHAHAVDQAFSQDSSGQHKGLLGLGRSVRSIIWACHPEFPCGGHGDRLKGIFSTFVFAMLTNRMFFIDAPMTFWGRGSSGVRTSRLIDSADSEEEV